MLKAFADGRLGRDAEQRTVGNGTIVVSFAIACDKRKGQDKITVWVDCAMFGERAAKLQQYLVKGTVVSVVGDIELQEFTRRDGSPGSKLSIRVDDLTLLGGGQRDSQPPAPSGGYDQRPTNAGAGRARPPRDDIDDSIPF